MKTLFDPPDICARKHRGNLESRDANKRNAKVRSVQERLILTALAMRGERGAGGSELQKAFDMYRYSVSARLADLKRKGLAYVDGRRRSPSGGTEGIHKLTEAGKAEAARVAAEAGVY